MKFFIITTSVTIIGLGLLLYFNVGWSTILSIFILYGLLSVILVPLGLLYTTRKSKDDLKELLPPALAFAAIILAITSMTFSAWLEEGQSAREQAFMAQQIKLLEEISSKLDPGK